MEVVEDRAQFRISLGEVRRTVSHHRHEWPLGRRIAEIRVVLIDQAGHQLALLGDLAEYLEIVARGLEPVIRPDLGVELRKPFVERAGLRKAVELTVKIEA